MFKVSLFIPCFIDQLYPEASKASLNLLEKVGCDVVFLENVLCAGQRLRKN
ncbi:heterodisulfide reductase-related iron-sulfur binding cluster [Gramella sp. AN32]|uniref:Heterodisulfide reductase-related iron-sulfur binding cluster n=1 Tax=Christiangramia antarctica TaxID=2058158 RepID=A0ABW5X2E0_9FLAO|nr:heterodisulfide reductase-related iron-sulfur binding cluster [Gramella sp. AN32]MCM4157001.1 hypothetical protein [Gramella sp. AN32]